jgi:hypothetical protein
MGDPRSRPGAPLSGAAGEPARRLARLWQQGQRPSPEEFLAQAGDLPLAEIVAVLRVDQRQRWLAGCPVTPEDYLRRFPALAGADEHFLDLVYAEVLIRQELGQTPAPQEYEQRFPQLADELHLQLQLNALWHDPPASGEEDPTPVQTVPQAPPGDHWPAVPGYEVLAELGRGGMGVVYKAKQVNANRLVALKMLQAPHPADEDGLARFRVEAEAAARLQHPNIVQVFDVGQVGGRPFFSLELIEGGSLERRLDGTPQPAGAAACLVETLARALHAAHLQGVVHRDLKPANILLASGEAPAGSAGRAALAVRRRKNGESCPVKDSRAFYVLWV